MPFVSDTGSRLEALREPYFEARIEVLKLLRRHLDLGAAGLIHECLDALLHSLSIEDLRFLLAMDQLYLGASITDPPGLDLSPKMTPGGVTNLLLVAGHVERESRMRSCELLWGTLLDDDEFKSKVEREEILPSFDPLRCPARLRSVIRGESGSDYFAAFSGDDERQAVDVYLYLIAGMVTEPDMDWNYVRSCVLSWMSQVDAGEPLDTTGGLGVTTASPEALSTGDASASSCNAEQEDKTCNALDHGEALAAR